MVHEIPTMISDDLDYMARDAGLKVDDLCRTAISAKATSSTQIVAPDGSTTTNVLSATNLKQSALFQANTRLASNKAPTYADGTYAGVFHPKQTHDLFIATSGGSQLNRILLGSTNVGGFLENTEFGAQKLARATMGTLGNIRIIQNTNAPKAHNGGAAAAGFSAGASGWSALIMGPGAAAAVDLQTARLKTFIKPLGSAGALDGLNQLMTAGLKFYFVAVMMDGSNRLLSIPSGKTL
jgi:N4-gp56 family major capsid protein